MLTKRSFYYRDIGLNLLIGFLALQLVGVAISFAVDINTMTGLLIAQASGHLAFITVYFVLNLAKSVDPLHPIKLKFSPWYLLAALFASVVMYLAIPYAAVLFDFLLKLTGYESVNPLSDIEITPVNLTAFILVIAVLPAIGEELMFRVVVLQGLRRKYGTTASILISSALFALFHSSPDQTLFPFFLGLIFAFLTVRSGSAVPAMFMHFLNNLFSLLAELFGLNLWFDSVGLIIILALILSPAALFAITFFIDLFGKTLYKNTIFMSVFKLFARSDHPLLMRRQAYLNEEAAIKSASATDPDNSIAPPLPTGNPEQDALNNSMYYEFTRSAKLRQDTQNSTSRTLLFMTIAMCGLLWLVSMFMGYIGTTGII